jgi:hypothetical protein
MLISDEGEDEGDGKRKVGRWDGGETVKGSRRWWK